jgi:peptidyl-prolyl cis-trans isomerase-like 1
MTNKTLIIIIGAIVILCAAGAGYFYWQQTKPLKVTDDYLQSQKDKEPNMDQDNQQQTGIPTTTPETAAVSGECKRDFDQNTLNTAKVAIANRQVEIDVKGFGKIKLEFYDKDAPKTVENFLRLTNSGYYNCLTFHRVSKGFVIQGGDPNGDGSGGFSAFGAKFADELDPNTASAKTGYVKGVLAMANAGPNTNGSQFFILLEDQTSWMPHNYTIFGKVSSGMDVVDKIGQVAITPQMSSTDGAPVTPVVMTSVKIIK